MSPEYFKTRLTWQEAGDYMAGVNRRYRASWQQSRLIADVQARCAGNKQGIKLDFPWEKLSQSQPEYTKEQIASLKAECDAWVAQKNAELNNNPQS